MSYADEKKLISYWINTSTNALITESLLGAKDEFQQKFEQLIIDGHVEVEVNLEASFVEVENEATLWGLFINGGYLTVISENVERGLLTVKIPNREVEAEFRRMVSAHTKISSQKLQDMLTALIDWEPNEFVKIYRELVLESTSYYAGKENAYHMLMLGMVLPLRDLYKITSNLEHGFGRTDIIMESKDGKRPHVIIEFKQGEEVQKLKVEALRQIVDRRYDVALEGDILCVGIAHQGKICELAYELITK